MSAAPKTAVIQAMEHTVRTADVPPYYLTRSVYQPVTQNGLATRINEMYENRLYARRGGDDFVWLADTSIPSDLIREVLQTTAADRILEIMQNEEASLAASRHASREGLPIGEPLRDLSPAISRSFARQVHADAARQIMTNLDRDLLGREISENF